MAAKERMPEKLPCLADHQLINAMENLVRILDHIGVKLSTLSPTDQEHIARARLQIHLFNNPDEER